MARLLLAVAIVAASAGCGADTATQERVQQPRTDAAASTDSRAAGASPAVAVPETAADRHIRRALSSALAHDSALKDRHISFIVNKGDVSVTGTVKTEDERRRINELAMSTEGVRSVANAVLIAE
jgi:osmotically-inducible protein OsmY